MINPLAVLAILLKVGACQMVHTTIGAVDVDVAVCPIVWPHKSAPGAPNTAPDHLHQYAPGKFFGTERPPGTNGTAGPDGKIKS